MPVDCPPWVEAESASKLQSVVEGMGLFMRFVLKQARTYILQHGDIKTWHGRIFRDAVPLSYYAGNYRSDDPERPCLAKDVEVAGLAGAPYREVPQLMKLFSQELRHLVIETDRYLTSSPTPVNRARSVVMLVATVVGKLIKIHPFLNGNGRMARLVANYLFFRYSYPIPFYSAYPRPQVGYAEASAACMSGNFALMYRYFLTILAIQSRPT